MPTVLHGIIVEVCKGRGEFFGDTSRSAEAETFADVRRAVEAVSGEIRGRERGTEETGERSNQGVYTASGREVNPAPLKPAAKAVLKNEGENQMDNKEKEEQLKKDSLNQQPRLAVKSPNGIIWFPKFTRDENGNWTLPDKEHWNQLLDLQDSEQQSEPQPPDEVQQKEELSMTKENETESPISTDQPEQSITSEQKAEPECPKNGVFIRRPKGMSFDDFKEFCIKKFREAGLIKD